MRPDHHIILTLLSAEKAAIERKDIWQKLEPSEQGTLKSIDMLSKHLNTLREKDYIENGLSNYIDNKAILTWKITAQGRYMLSKEKPAQTQTQIQSEKPAAYQVEPAPIDEEPLTLIESIEITDPVALVGESQTLEITDPSAYVQAVHESIQELVVKLMEESKRVKKELPSVDKKISILSAIVDFNLFDNGVIKEIDELITWLEETA
jgi:hypothetical protein